MVALVGLQTTPILGDTCMPTYLELESYMSILASSPTEGRHGTDCMSMRQCSSNPVTYPEYCQEDFFMNVDSQLNPLQQLTKSLLGCLTGGARSVLIYIGTGQHQLFHTIDLWFGRQPLHNLSAYSMLAKIVFRNLSYAIIIFMIIRRDFSL